MCPLRLSYEASAMTDENRLVRIHRAGLTPGRVAFLFNSLLYLCHATLLPSTLLHTNIDYVCALFTVCRLVVVAGVRTGV